MGKLYIPPNVLPSIFSDEKYINKIKGIRINKSDVLLEQICTSNELIILLLNQQINGLINILNSLPINYPLQRIHLSGLEIEVTHYIGIDNNIASFNNGNTLLMIDASKIIGITY